MLKKLKIDLPKLKVDLPYDVAIPPLGISTKEISAYEKDTCILVFIAALFTVAEK